MPFQTSDFAFDEGVQGRYLFGSLDVVDFNYPTAPDNLWRLIMYGSMQYAKQSSVGDRNLEVQLFREGEVNRVYQVFMRRFTAGDSTSSSGDLQGAEMQSTSSAYYVNLVNTTGRGILMPPRTQIRARLNDLNDFSAILLVFILETADVAKLKPYM